jgi:Flp pilus assembly protein TadG
MTATTTRRKSSSTTSPSAHSCCSTMLSTSTSRPHHARGRGSDGVVGPQSPVQRDWWAWWRSDRGSVAAEVTLLAPFMILMLVFVAVLIHRGVEVRLRLDDAAHQAARAASIERSAPAAAAAAQSTAAGALASATKTCVALTAQTATAAMRPGGTVSVTLTCTIDYGDAVLLGVPGQTSMLATATEPVDTYRSITTGPGGTG